VGMWGVEMGGEMRSGMPAVYICEVEHLCFDGASMRHAVGVWARSSRCGSHTCSNRELQSHILVQRSKHIILLATRLVGWFMVISLTPLNASNRPSIVYSFMPYINSF
jgi:hypothetical protein